MPLCSVKDSFAPFKPLKHNNFANQTVEDGFTGVQRNLLHDRGSRRRCVLPSAVGNFARRLCRMMGLKRAECTLWLAAANHQFQVGCAGFWSERNS